MSISPNEPMTSLAKATRDRRIDFFRGAALLFIYIDHIPGNFLSRITLHNFGFSDAAELFVLLAGVSAAFAYGRRRDATSAVLQRAWTIYVAHVALLLAVAAALALIASYTKHPSLMRHVALAPFADDLGKALVGVLTLTLQPPFLDILPLYVALLVWFPVLLALSRIRRWLGLGISLVIWVGANATHINAPTMSGNGWYFNPLTWQLLFALGVYIGMRKGRSLETRALPDSRVLLWIAIAYLVFSLLYCAPWQQIPVPEIRRFRLFPDNLLGDIEKTHESGWRLLHVLCLAYVTTRLAPARSDWLDRPWARRLIALGESSLMMFVLASVASIMASVVLTLSGGGKLYELLTSAVGLMILLVVGNLNAMRRRSLRFVPHATNVVKPTVI